ncbi:MAG: ATP-binding cassette domain-containing protein, partial [Firmicutes bacterium]|nr:ATP-binding cassette domain-containing protein [Bacillota bacterium]
MELLRFEEYTFFYNDTDSPALDGINLSVGAGEIVAVCGPSGSGKSTLINSCKPQTAPAGRHTGVIPARPPSGEIAVVFQNPETQIVTTTVINDLVFQMENLGFDRLTMRRRMAETVGFFGLEGLLRRPVGELSGGQKQLVSLCAAMMTRPRLLLLDEPVSQLDPISGGALLETLRRINEEFAVTILLSEHRLDDVAGIARRIVYMERGKIVFDAPARETLTALFRSGRPETACFAPPIPRSSISIDGYAALSPKEFQERYAKPPVKTETPDKRDALPGGRADVTPDSRDAPPDGARDNRDAVPDGRDALPGSRVDAPDNHNAPQDAAPDNSDAVPDNRDAPPDGARDNRDAVPDNRDVLPVSRADASEFRRGAQCASASAANGTGNILQTP